MPLSLAASLLLLAVQGGSVEIVSATPLSQDVPVYGVAQVHVELKAEYQNPFDPEDIRLDAEVRAPSGRTYNIPGYFLGKGWHVRFSPQESGAHQVVLKAAKGTATASSAPLEIRATPSDSPGLIRVSEQDPRFFVDSLGEPFFAIGMNYPRVGSVQGVTAQMQKFAEAGGNTARLFLNPPSSPFALHKKGFPAHLIDLEAADRLEQALQNATASGIRVILVLETPETLGSGWAISPYGEDNGGPLRTAESYWSSEPMRKLVQNRLRYLVARYGAYSSLLAWELWHEPDLLTTYKEAETLAWHELMAQHLDQLDPYGRMISTGLANPLGVKDLDRMTAIDYSQSHLAEVPDFAPQVSLMQARKVSYGKPHLVTMVAGDRASDMRQLDPKGLQYHDAVWASITSGAAGTAMPWWNELIRDKELYWIFRNATKFIEGVDWPEERFRQVRPEFSFIQVPRARPRQDLVIAGGPTSLRKTEYNLPRRVRITEKGIDWGYPVSGILHGKRNRAYLHNPVTFIVDQPRQTQLDVEIGDVSGEGGAKIKIVVDGVQRIVQDFPDPNDRNLIATRTEYRGQVVSVPIPPGRHEVTVSNIGNDWVKAGYRFRDLLERKDPGLSGYAMLGDNTVLIWARPTDRTYRRVAVLKRNVPATPPAVLGLTGLASGKWSVEFWDTWGGAMLEKKQITVPLDGILKLEIPAISRDLAIKMTRSR